MFAGSPRGGHRSRVVTGLSLLVVGLTLLVAVPARAAVPAPHWSVRSVVVRDELTSASHRDALVDAVRLWSAAGAQLQLRIQKGTGQSCQYPKAGEIAVCGYQSTENWGEAYRWTSEGHITRSAIYLERTQIPASRLTAVACHELGHALGLEHREAAETCMATEPAWNAPDEHDLAAVRRAHDHEDQGAAHCRGAVIRWGDTCILRMGGRSSHDVTETVERHLAGPGHRHTAPHPH